MITIICGEDTVASRKYLTNAINNYKTKGIYVQKIQPNQIEEVAKAQNNEMMLFNDKKVYQVDRLTTYTAKKKSKDFVKLLVDLGKDPSTELIDWEDKSGREIKIKEAIVKEFKPSQSIFQLQEALYPGNLVNFVTSLNKTLQTQEEGFIFVMICRYVRTLVLARTNQLPSTVPSWMKNKLADQAGKWQTDALIGFYEGLARLDTATKTSSSIYGVKKSLELLACYYIK